MTTMEDIKARCLQVGECWEWQGAFDGAGTPVLRHKGDKKLTQVRRHVLSLKGKNIDGLLATNTCDNRKCVCPAHAAAWTRKKLQGRIAKKIRGMESRKRALSLAARKRSKANEEIVRQMRESGKSPLQLMAETGFGETMVRQILSHETWKDYSNPFAGLGART